MPRKYAIALLAVAGAVLARPHALSAQQLPAGVTASAEFGGRSFTQNLTALQLGKFTEYKDLPSGAVLSSFLLGYTPGDSLRTFQLQGRNIGQLDQTMKAQFKQAGVFDLSLQWDRLLHTFSTDGRLLGSRPTPDYFSLAGTPRVDTTQVNAAVNGNKTYLGPERIRWAPLKFALGYTPSEALDSHIEYTRVSKGGDRPMGMAFGSPGNNAREILEPIDQTTHDLKISQGFARERAQFVVSYDMSIFQNGYTSVTADNPLMSADSPTNGPAKGRTALTPNNVAHTVLGSGGLSLPLSTRVTGTLSYSWWLQNQTFIPVTSNSAITDPRVAALPTSLGGRAGTSVINLTADSRPTKELSLSARFRRYSFRDAADVSSVPVEIVNDRSVSGASDVARDPFSRETRDVSGNYVLLRPLSLFAGYNWEQMKLDNPERNTPQYTEITPRVGFLFTGTDWLSLRTTYSTSKRRNDGYENGTGYITGWQRFDLSDRDRERYMVVSTLTPLDQIGLSATWTVGHDNYPDVQYGVQNDNSAAIGGDIEWTPSPRFSIGGGWSSEQYHNRMSARYRTPTNLNNATYDWVANNVDHSTVTSANMTAVLVPDKFDAAVNFQMSHSRFMMATYNPTAPTGGAAADIINATATDLPEISQSLQPLDVSLRYRLTTDWAATVRFQSEMFGQNDFRLIGNHPGWWNMMFLGNQFQNYNAQFLTFTLTFHPDMLKGRRSTL